MKIEEIKHVADISELNFSDEKLNEFAKEFNETLDMLQSINGVDTEGVVETYRIHDDVGSLRPDVPKESLSNSEALKNTVDEKYGYFSIIKFVE